MNYLIQTECEVRLRCCLHFRMCFHRNIDFFNFPVYISSSFDSIPNTKCVIEKMEKSERSIYELQSILSEFESGFREITNKNVKVPIIWTFWSELMIR